MLQLTSGLRRIELVRAMPFRVGAIQVDPPTRTIRADGRAEVLEPRVMQTLVALAEAEGAVVSRDDLIDRCWDSRIVGDNAINRTVSRIRQAAATLAPGSLEIETITKVGYRLVGQPQTIPPLRSRLSAPRTALPPAVDRRRLLIGTGAALTVAGVAGTGWWRSRRRAPLPKARDLYERGVAVQRIGTPDQVVQAPAFFEQAVAIDPDYADAWGALSLAYRHILEGFAAGDGASLPVKIASAAKRALALDPGNADARLALIIVRPFYRNWQTIERGLRAFVADHPRHWLGVAQLGLLLIDVGRVEDSIPFQRRVIEIDPFLPVAHAMLGRAYSIAGRVQECDATLDAAMRRWPTHPVLWAVRYNSLLYRNRAGEALALAMNPAMRPQAFSPEIVERRQLIARALDSGAPGDVARAVALTVEDAASSPAAISSTVPVLAALGREDAAFATLLPYFFGDTAHGIAPPKPYERRGTVVLFSPPMQPFADDPRMIDLIERTGVADYYRATGSRPDIRRVG